MITNDDPAPMITNEYQMSTNEYLRSLTQATQQLTELDDARRETRQLEPGETAKARLVPAEGLAKGEERVGYSLVTDEYDKAIEVRLQLLTPEGADGRATGARLILSRAGGGGVALENGDLSAVSDSSGLAVVSCGRDVIKPGRWSIWVRGRGLELTGVLEFQICYSTVRSSAELELSRNLHELELVQRQAEAQLKKREEVLHGMFRFGQMFHGASDHVADVGASGGRSRANTAACDGPPPYTETQAMPRRMGAFETESSCGGGCGRGKPATSLTCHTCHNLCGAGEPTSTQLTSCSARVARPTLSCGPACTRCPAATQPTSCSARVARPTLSRGPACTHCVLRALPGRYSRCAAATLCVLTQRY